MDDVGHTPVLGREVLELLSPRGGEVCVDCTAGRGGHAAMVGPRLAPGGRMVCLDVDPANLDFARRRLEGIDVPVTFIHGNFEHAPALLARAGVSGVDLLLADLGFASTQVDDPSRGLSFREDGPLDMRLDRSTDVTAADLVNRLPEGELADVIYQFGEERRSRRIARKIAEVRKQGPIKTTAQLAEVVRRAASAPGGGGRARKAKGTRSRIDPATRTFQALRIAVNRELEVLDRLLQDAPAMMRPGGRVAIISFHSLEDRRVKQAMLAWQQAGRGRRLTRKPVTAAEEETRANPRSRSAKLRAFEFGKESESR